jgi:hypothetical protein
MINRFKTRVYGVQSIPFKHELGRFGLALPGFTATGNLF